MQLNRQINPAELSKAYAAALPFPHCSIDGLFPGACLSRIADEIDGLPESVWWDFDNERELKRGLIYPGFRATPLYLFLAYLNSPEVLGFLEGLTGITGLIPDPYYKGGGVHYIRRGGYLAVHSDFNWHPDLMLDRRLNLLVFLNRDWKEEYGGHLELWNATDKECRERILPVFNRTVVFNTSDGTFHGHPHPLRCPPGMARKSLSTYYYTNGRPEEEKSAPHDTIFLDQL